MRLDSVHFSRPVHDPVNPNGMGKQDFATPDYGVSIEGVWLVIERGGRRYLYPSTLVGWALESKLEPKAVARGR